MNKFVSKTFNIPPLKGISQKNIEEHLKLYNGYVKNANMILDRIDEIKTDAEKYPFEFGELHRRFGFEYNGMRNHEIYFDSLSDGAKSLDQNSALAKKLVETCNSVEIFVSGFKNIALTRGIGWAMLWYDKKDERLLMSWVDEQHLGQLSGCVPILALDMWEHSYVSDYQPSGKKKYIEDFFANLNWEKIENNFETASK